MPFTFKPTVSRVWCPVPLSLILADMLPWTVVFWVTAAFHGGWDSAIRSVSVNQRT